jgi:peptidyl-prolyl cis-trans isomerase D
MLLSLMRKHAKSWLIKILIGIIALVFIFYFGYSFTSDEGAKVAEVNGEVISLMEYENAYRELLTGLQQEYQDMWSDSLIEAFDLKSRALESLIEEKIIRREAEKTGLDVTEKEIRDRIIEFPAFQYNGSFDSNRYRALLANYGMSAEDFEESIAQELLQEKLMQFLTTFLVVSDQEVLDYYTYLNERVKISFVRFSAEDFKDSINVDYSLMENFFEQHREVYRIPENIRTEYIVIHPEDFRDQVDIDELEIRGYYGDNPSMFKQEKEVRARHILFRVPSDTTEDEQEKIKEKALSVLEKARSGQDFSELAREYSEAPTKEKGGDLGYFSEGQMVESFEEAAFNMEKGQISDLVKTTYGYHIIKVDDIKEERVKDFEEVRDRILDILIGNESEDLAHERALSLIDRMPYDIDLAEYAAENDIPVISTEYFSQEDPIPYIQGDEKLKQLVFSLQNKEISEVIEFDDDFYIIQVMDRKPSYLPEMDEVAGQVEADYKDYLATMEAKSAAERYLEKLRQGNDWDELAEEMNMQPETTDFFTRLDFPENIGGIQGLNEAAFNLSENNRYPEAVFEGEEGVFVIRWEDKQGIDKEKYQEEKQRYADSIISSKRQVLYYSWLERLKDRADIDRSRFARYK